MESNSSLEDRRLRIRAKRAIVGVGARALFYPTLFYNVFRNKTEPEFRWWDKVDEFILLGAVPFPKDVPRLKQLGVQGVITLNESYETLVPTSLYKDHGINHLELPTRDYLYAPSYTNLCQAVNFIHRNVLSGITTYVHCKAGRGRSTTVVLCYLIEYKSMTPDEALSFVRAIRPRVLLATTQWKAVHDYARRKKAPPLPLPSPLDSLEDDSIILVTEEDLKGYTSNGKSRVRLFGGLRTVLKAQILAGQSVMKAARASAEFARSSCIRFSQVNAISHRHGPSLLQLKA